MKKLKLRNPYVLHMLQLKSGVHKKSNSAKRQLEKKQTKTEVSESFLK
jgi:hypothetical protein